MDLYRDLILDYYKHPRNFGHLAHVDATAESYNATCGDRIMMEIVLDKKHKVKDIRFSGVGCAISIASASMITEKVIGMDVQKILDLPVQSILDVFGTSLTPSRTKCATLPLEVLHKAILSMQAI